MVIGGGLVVFMHMTCVFVVLIFRPACFAYSLNLPVFSCRWSLFEDKTTRSSAKSRSSKWEKGVHWIPLRVPDVIWRMIQSRVSRNRKGERMHPCRTPDSTGNHSESVLLLMITLHSKWLQNRLIRVMVFSGIPYDLMMFQRVSLCTLSKAFLKSMKFMYNRTFHSMHCSMMFLRAKIWSMHPLPCLILLVPPSACCQLLVQSIGVAPCRRSCWGWKIM